MKDLGEKLLRAKQIHEELLQLGQYFYYNLSGKFVTIEDNGKEELGVIVYSNANQGTVTVEFGLKDATNYRVQQYDYSYLISGKMKLFIP